MRRLGVIVLGAALLAVPATSESDPQSARAFILEEATRFSPQPTAQLAVDRRRPLRASYAPDPTIVALVDKVADETGIPRAVMRFHVARESGFRPAARNPKSTATGMLQLIRGSHAAIIGRELTKDEHCRRASDPAHNLRVGAAHIKGCMALMPGASADRLWKGCHIRGHAAAGGRIEIAARMYRPDAQGWLSRGSVAMPWAMAEGSGA